MGFGWKAAPAVENIAVWPNRHPVSVQRANALNALFGFDLSDRNPMTRHEAGSAFNGTRFAGDLGPLQTFSRVYGFSAASVRVGQKSLPTAEGGSAAASPLLATLGATVG